jgi:type II secretory pathway pseudopilin PulG
MTTVRRDHGATLVEMLISIVLLGTVGVAVLAAMSAAIVAARTHDEVATVQSRLAQAVDAITDTEPEQIPYIDCADGPPLPAYQAALDAQFAPPGSVQVLSVEFWNAGASIELGQFGSDCRTATHGDRLQRVTLQAEFDGVAREVAVVKRPFAVPTVGVVPAPPVPPYTGGSGQATVSLTPGINGP